MSEPFIGEVRMFGGNFAPLGWAFCDGQLQSIEDNTALFTLIGTTYGGDGVTTFALPDLRSRVPVHFGTGTSGTSYVMGEAMGVESVTLNVNQIPTHTHTPTGATTAATSQSPAGAVPAKVSAGARYAGGGAPTPVAMHPQALPSVGGSQPHENMAPSLGINFIIALVGIFPTQN